MKDDWMLWLAAFLISVVLVLWVWSAVGGGF